MLQNITLYENYKNLYNYIYIYIINQKIPTLLNKTLYKNKRYTKHYKYFLYIYYKNA